MAIDIDHITARCVAQQRRLTPQRLQILTKISECMDPITAYGLKTRLDTSSYPVNISTIYRVLEFWIQLGIVHKVDSNRTYFICRDRHNHGLHIIQHCISCDQIAENTDLASYLALPRNSFFSPSLNQVIELKGQCRRCLEAKKTSGNT